MFTEPARETFSASAEFVTYSAEVFATSKGHLRPNLDYLRQPSFLTFSLSHTVMHQILYLSAYFDAISQKNHILNEMPADWRFNLFLLEEAVMRLVCRNIFFVSLVIFALRFLCQ